MECLHIDAVFVLVGTYIDLLHGEDTVLPVTDLDMRTVFAGTCQEYADSRGAVGRCSAKQDAGITVGGVYRFVVVRFAGAAGAGCARSERRTVFTSPLP